MAEQHDFGKLAEEKAAQMLIDKGFEILEKNYRYLKSEIDIIAKKDQTLIIVEVKARSTDIFIEPQEAINKKKMRLMVMGANHFAENYSENLEVRFDVITAVDEQGKLQLRHIESAFDSIDAC